MGSSVKYIHELPYEPRKQLCRLLDADSRWEELGGIYMKYDITTLSLIGQAIFCGKSPTSELFNKYGERNGTLERLFIWLCRMNHQRAMHILQPYVSKKKCKLHSNNSEWSICIPSNLKDNSATSRPVSQHSKSSTSSLLGISKVTSTHKQICKESTSCKKKDGISSINEKSEDKCTTNKYYSSNFLKSKSCNVSHVEPKSIAGNTNQLEERVSYAESESRDLSMSNLISNQKLETNKETSSSDNDTKKGAVAPPIPLLPILQMPVSEGDSKESDSENELTW